MEFREAVRIGVRAEGRDADRGQMPVKELTEVLGAVSNIARRTTSLVATRSLSVSPAVQVLVQAPQSGCFVVEFAVQIAANIAANLLTPPILEVIKRAYRVAIGRDAQPGERIEPSLPWPDQIAELSEALHPSFKKLSEPVDQSATTISLYDASKPYKQGSELFTIDSMAKEELAYEVVGSAVEVFGGRVRVLNDRTRRGIFDLDQPRPHDLQNLTRSLRFWMSENSSQQQTVAALAANLANNNSLAAAPKTIAVRARRVTTRTGGVKRILIDGLAQG